MVRAKRTGVLSLWREAGPGGIWEMVLGPEWLTGDMAGPGIGDQLQGEKEYATQIGGEGEKQEGVGLGEEVGCMDAPAGIIASCPRLRYI